MKNLIGLTVEANCAPGLNGRCRIVEIYKLEEETDEVAKANLEQEVEYSDLVALVEFPDGEVCPVLAEQLKFQK